MPALETMASMRPAPRARHRHQPLHVRLAADVARDARAARPRPQPRSRPRRRCPPAPPASPAARDDGPRQGRCRAPPPSRSPPGHSPCCPSCPSLCTPPHPGPSNAAPFALPWFDRLTIGLESPWAGEPIEHAAFILSLLPLDCSVGPRRSRPLLPWFDKLTTGVEVTHRACHLHPEPAALGPVPRVEGRPQHHHCATRSLEDTDQKSRTNASAAPPFGKGTAFQILPHRPGGLG